MTGGSARLACVMTLALAAGPAGAGEALVAVAANFADPLATIAEVCEASTGHSIRASLGSTGKLYSQILHGAPFEVLLAADAETPRRLEAEGVAVVGTRFTYAVGRLALWSRDPARIDGTSAVLVRGDFRHLALANPDTAPYGAAAREVLARLDLWERVEDRLVRGESVGQAFQFVATGNAELGFVALSQLARPAAEGRAGSRWVVPEELHSPIEQQAALLSAGRASEAARAFLDCLQSEPVAEIIRRHGYRTVER